MHNNKHSNHIFRATATLLLLLLCVCSAVARDTTRVFSRLPWGENLVTSGANGLGGAYTNEYNYDDLYRLTAANGNYSGNNTNYSLEMSYTPAGRLCSKLQDFTGTGNVYAYSQNNKPHAVRRYYNGLTNELYNLLWDANGNLAQQTVYSVNNNVPAYQNMRALFWDEDDRLNLVAGDGYLSYYAYGHDGNRAIKMTGNAAIDQTGTLLNSTNLENITIYPSEYLTVTQAEYTKYYYAGGNRIASKIGTGGFEKMTRLCTLDQGPTYNANNLLNFVLYQVTNISNQPTDEYPVDVCNGYSVATELLTNPLPNIYISNTSLNFTQNNLLQQFRQNLAGGTEPVYYFHSDHLGSASWITNNTGLPVQHLLYLPFGEHFVNEQSTGYNERFTFTGKERDAETGYYYHGARFNSSDLGWLSVDPMVDKYPEITPYHYCHWNPIKLIDPDGRDEWDLKENGTLIWVKDSEKDIVRAKDGTYVNVGDGTMTKGKSYISAEDMTFGFGSCKNNAIEFFEFLADNTNVEWSLLGYEINDSYDYYSIYGSLDKKGEHRGAEYALGLAQKGYCFFLDVHNHPDGNIQPSSFLNSSRKYTDISYRDALIKANENIKESCSFFIYVKYGKYRQYGGMKDGQRYESSVDKKEQYIISRPFKAF